MFTENKMTPPHRESLQTLLDDIYSNIIETIAKNRELEPEFIKDVVENSTFMTDDYLKTKLIDEIAYEDEILEKLKKKSEPIDFRVYRQTTFPSPFKGKQSIAIIFASGELHSGESGKESAFTMKVLGSDTLLRFMRNAKKNPSIKAVILRINSPGGASIASDIVRREAELLANKKPLVISMSDYAASGGYWISLAGAKILALPQTITGSIGALGGKFVLKDLYDKIGLKKEILKTSQHADLFSDYRSFTAGEKEKMMSLLKQLYYNFIKLVSDRRKIDIKEVEKIARGRVWSGKSALRIKLIDEFGGILKAITEAKKLAKIPPAEEINLRIYPQKKSLLSLVTDLFAVKVSNFDPINKINTMIGLYRSFFPALLVPYKIQVN